MAGLPREVGTRLEPAVGEGEGRALAVDIVFAGLCQLEDRKAPSGILSPDVCGPGLTRARPAPS